MDYNFPSPKKFSLQQTRPTKGQLVITIQRSAIGTAPGKLDFLGGFSESDGGLTLQVQTQAKTTVLVTEGSDLALNITSTQRGQFRSNISEFKKLLSSQPTNQKAKQWLNDFEVPIWARYVAACVIIFNREFSWTPHTGLAFAISSDVPMGVGIGSSAALEVATLHALEKLSGFYFTERRLAEVAIELEREIIGHRNDVVSQLSAAYGKPGCLLPISSRVDTATTPIEIPKGVTIVGWSSASEPSENSSNRPQTIRDAAYIANRIAKDTLNEKWEYVTDILPSRYLKHLENRLPESLSGAELAIKYPEQKAEFLPDFSYPIRAAFAFSIFENQRSSLAAQLLSNMAHNSKRKVVELLGELMLQSHINYSRLGLTNQRIDAMVEAFANAGPDNGIFGARISGHGSGNAIVALVDKKALKIVRDLIRSFDIDEASPIALIR